MKRIAIAAAVAVFATAAQTTPLSNTWYSGTKLGWSHFENTNFHPQGDNVASNKTKHDQLGAGAHIGYQHNQYLSFELGYDWFGKMEYISNPHNRSLKPMGVQLTARLSYPITDVVDIYIRLGGMIWRTNTIVNLDNKPAYKEDYIDASPIYALGLEYNISPIWTTSLDYQFINHINNRDPLFISPNNGMLRLGISYKFNQNTTPIITPTSEIIKDKQFTLNSKVLFKFNKYTLQPTGKASLDKLYNTLINLNPNKGCVIVLGHADRIGPSIYNKNLSQKRANEVVNYLISKGIPTNTISSQSYGNKNPVTGNSCNNIKPRTELINCLAPDRRVEIMIYGTKEATS